MARIQTSTRLKSQKAAVSGTSAQIVSGDGSAAAQAGEVQGVGGTSQLISGSGGAISQNAAVSGNATAGAPGSLTWEWNVPSLQDETDFYTNVMGWIIPSDAATDWNDAGWPWDDPASWNISNPHQDSEGDDLWAWDQQEKRYGPTQTVRGSQNVSDWKTRALTWTKDNLLTAYDNHEEFGDTGTGHGMDHVTIQGIATIYHDTGDSDLLTLANGIRTRLEALPRMQDLLASTPIAMSQFLLRGPARWSLVSAYGFQAFGGQAWQDLRDACIFGLLNSPDWEEGGVIANGGGMYFGSSSQAGFDGISGYAGGRRYQGTWHIGIAAEAMWRLYIQTGNTSLRDRLIKMARYVQYYAHKPEWNFPNIGSRFGHEGDGTHFHNSNGNADGTQANAARGPQYDAGVINCLVYAYKLTGDSALLDRAKIHMARCNRHEEGSPYAEMVTGQSATHVYRYVDTQANPNRKYFYWNKGVLQYCYPLFENGGNPSVIGASSTVTGSGTPQSQFAIVTGGGTVGPVGTGVIEQAANALSSGSWGDITNSMDNGTFGSLSINTNGSTARTLLNYASDAFWNSSSKEIHIRGGGATSGDSTGEQRHIRFGEARQIWDAVTPWFNTGQAHQWGGFCGDPTTGDLYYLVGRGNKDVEKWTYASYPLNGSWGDIDNEPFGSFSNAGGAMAFFPELNGGAGGLVAAIVRSSQSYDVYTSNAAGNSWTLSHNTGDNDLGIEFTMQYLPSQQLVIFGGGSQAAYGTKNFQVFTMDSSGSVTKRSNLPFAYGAGDGICCGPIVGHTNGRVFGVSAVSNRIWEWNGPSNDTWNDRGALPQSCDSLVGVMIPEYNVIYCAVLLGDSATSGFRHWIYKL